MANRTLGLLLLLGLSLTAGAQQYEFAVSGADFPCFILPIVSEQAWFYFPDPPQPDLPRESPVVTYDTPMIAGGAGGVVFGVKRTSEVVRFTANGLPTPFFGGIAGAQVPGIAVAPSGRIYRSVYRGGVAHLAVISPAGVQEAIYPLPGSPFPEILAVAPDSCTVYYANVTGIKRINGCTGAPLPDLVALEDVNDIEILPNGELLVAAGQQVFHYSAAGALIRTVTSLASYGFNASATLEEVALSNGVLWIVASQGCETELLRVAFDTGAEVRARLELTLVTASGLVINSATAANVPTAGEVALTLLAFAIAAAGSFVLRLR